MGGTKKREDVMVVLGRSKRQPWEDEPLTELDRTEVSTHSKRSPLRLMGELPQLLRLWGAILFDLRGNESDKRAARHDVG